MNLQDVMMSPNTEFVQPTQNRNPWGSVKSAEAQKAANAWIDDMLKSKMIDQKQAAALKMELMQKPQMEPMDNLSQDPKFLNKVFGK